MNPPTSLNGAIKWRRFYGIGSVDAGARNRNKPTSQGYMVE